MSAAPTRNSDSPTGPDPEEMQGRDVASSRWILGPLLTVGFYLALTQIEGHPRLQSLFRGHPVQYAETALFFFVLAILLRRTLALIRERQALRLVAIDVPSLRAISTTADRAASLLAATASVPAGIRNSRLVSRIRELCVYTKSRGSAASAEVYLRYLGDLAIEKLNAGHSRLTTLIWCLAVVGGIGVLASLEAVVRGLGVDKSEIPLASVLSGMGGCFDPAVQALVLSLILILLRLVIERHEAAALARIEQFGIAQLGPCFNDDAQNGGRSLFVEAEAEAARALIERTESLIQVQTELWQKSLEETRARWAETAQKQQQAFAQALEQGMVTGLASHSEQLDDARAEFLKGFRAVGLELARITAGLQQTGEDHQSVFVREISEVWQKMQKELASAREDHEAQWTRSIGAVDAAVRGWQDELARATAAVTAQIHELQRQSEVLHRVVGHEDELVRLQTTLAHNLQSVRAMEAFEESIHSLNAAVHLLTMRAKSHAA